MFNIVTPENDENYALFERYLARSFSFAVTGLTTLLRLLLVTKIRKITDKKSFADNCNRTKCFKIPE